MNITRLLHNPVLQALILVAGSLFLHLLVLVFMSGSSHFYHYVIAAAVLLLYAFMNAVYLLKHEELTSYFRNSIYGFLLLLFFGYAFSRIFSSPDVIDMRSIKWILFIITFSYLIFLTIAFLMRKIMEYAERQDTETRR